MLDSYVVKLTFIYIAVAPVITWELFSIYFSIKGNIVSYIYKFIN